LDVKSGAHRTKEEKNVASISSSLSACSTVKFFFQLFKPSKVKTLLPRKHYKCSWREY